MNNKRTIIMIRPKFQGKIGFFTGLMAVMGILIGVGSFILLPVLAGAFSTQRTYIPTNLLDMLMLSFPWLVVGVGLIFAFAVFGGIYYSHRIAGPLYKIESILQRKLAGEMTEMIHLRPNDHLHELSKLINDLMETAVTTEMAAQDMVDAIEAAFAQNESDVALSHEQRANIATCCQALKASLGTLK